MSYAVRGLNKYEGGIASFRHEKDVVEAEIEVMKEMGVEFVTGCEVGKDVTIQELRDKGYAAFYVAVGLQSGGNIGADVARTALRAGADKVYMYALEGYDELAMGIEDRTECEEEGISVNGGWGSVEIKSKDGKVCGLCTTRCEFDAIRLERDHPKASVMYTAEEGL